MRRLVTALIVTALVAAACGGEDSTDSSSTTDGDQPTTTTEAPTTTADSQSTSTSEGETTGGVGQICALPSPDFGSVSDEVLCALYHSETTSDDVAEPQVDFVLDQYGLLQTISLHHGENFACMYLLGQVLVFPAFDPGTEEEFGLMPMEVGDDLQGYLNNVGLGWYAIADGNVDPYEFAQEIRSENRLASPHYVLAPTQGWKYGPGGIAVPVDGTWSQVEDQSENTLSASGRDVVVIDTGGIAGPLGVQTADQEPGGLPSEVQGHGQFIASVINDYNDMLSIDIVDASRGVGLVDELSVASALAAQVRGDEVVNMSLGTYACDDESVPLGLALGIALMPHELDGALNPPEGDPPITNVAVVAASGNDGPEITEAMYPARFGISGAPQFEPVVVELGGGPVTPNSLLSAEVLNDFMTNLARRVTAVGALTKPVVSADSPKKGPATIADWSNEAEVYVPGDSVVGWYTPAPELAVWSGTSFAAPRFAACLATGRCDDPSP